ncbi:uncharacterized protein LOC133144348 isoform X6 [Syngnathus typhle]|uniref:uncharacterized protein LOC133144348 isoform X6 n=1 Tax=Syngnathus typhle TaxID=161592 RepID=UPI002A6A3D5F|nr:uncharacterized protein LOC133144348 isoform X6 [Syngnathus typhle]
MVVSYEALLECAFSLYLGSAASHFKCQLRGGLTQNKTKSKNVGQHDCDGCPKITVDDRIYKTQIGEYFEIKCYISSTEQCSNDVTWYKMENDAFVPVTVDSHIEIKWKKLSNVTMLLLLCFTNIQESNSGSYHCASGLAVGHSINVSVYDNDIMANISFRNDTTGMSKEEIRWTYVYSAAGTIAFVVMVIFVSIILLQRCKAAAAAAAAAAKQRRSPKCANPLRQLRDERRRRKARKNERRQIRHVCHSRPPPAARRRRRYSRESEEASRRKFTLCRYTTGRSALTHDGKSPPPPFICIRAREGKGRTARFTSASSHIPNGNLGFGRMTSHTPSLLVATTTTTTTKARLI